MREFFALTMSEWQSLLRTRLMLMVTASTLVGYLLFPAVRFSADGLAVAVAVAMLCCGCTVLNQVQERNLDALMRRTDKRPVAAARLSIKSALLLALGLFTFSLCWLAQLSLPALLLGLFAVLWYNGFYTHFKRVTALAVLPGALCGAVPPLIGWSVAGGTLTHPAIGLLSGLLSLWQVPHFLLFVSRHREDYRRAGFPVFAASLSVASLRRILTVWLVAVSCSFLLLPAFGLLHGAIFQFGAVLLAGCLLLATWYLVRRQDWGRLFVQLNLHMGLVLMILACDRLLLFPL
jgi:protoheme IX farnesyltransferase